MNRAVALRIAACGIMGLGAALLIAALLLSTYTTGKIAKIPLDVDATLISDGTGTAFDPASLNGDRFVIDRNVPLAMQEQITVESPSNADHVTLQVGTTLRRTDKQQDGGLLLALVDTVAVNRKTAMAVSSESNPGGAVAQPRASAADQNIKCPTRWPAAGRDRRKPADAVTAECVPDLECHACCSRLRLPDSTEIPRGLSRPLVAGSFRATV